jgi:radical SAM protein with 4Fe4S-binding SPASM domain
VRPDFREIYEHARRRGLILTLFTNGTLITEDLADFLAERPPFNVEVTMYGAGEETYRRVTGVAGAYERCMRGIELLLERKLPLALKTMVSRLNVHDVPAMERFARERGLRYYFDPLINPRLDGGRDVTELRIAPSEVVRLDMLDQTRADEIRQYCRENLKPARENARLYACNAGTNTFHVSPEGRLSACMMSREPSHDLLRSSFAEVWNTLYEQIQSLRLSPDSPCSRCSLLSLCGFCPGWALLERGSEQEPIPYLCEVARARAEAFGQGTQREEYDHAAAKPGAGLAQAVREAAC